jgi:uncharacterized protein YdeI (YjbR/CyaY-like superfamily)
MTSSIEAMYFERPQDFRAWLDANHATATELLVGFHKKGTGRPTLTWPESVAEALCYGWIDGVRRRVDDARYVIRFTPRKATSIWSTVNIALMQSLIAEGRARPAGIHAFERRSAARSEVYAYEQAEAAELSDDELRRFRAQPEAWAYFQARPASYRRTAVWRVVSAKRADTRERRLAELVECSAAGRTIPALTREPRRAPGA